MEGHTTDAKFKGDYGTPEISSSEGAWKIRIPDGSLDPIATVIALDFPAKPEIQTSAAKP